MSWSVLPFTFFWVLATEFFCGDHFAIKDRQKATFWKSELGVLRVQAVMPVLLAKRSSIFQYVWRRSLPVIGPLTFPNNSCANSEHYGTLCSADCFHVLDHASTSFQLKIKDAIHIQKEQPSLKQQLHHVNLKLSLLFSHFRAFASLYGYYWLHQHFLRIIKWIQLPSLCP